MWGPLDKFISPITMVYCTYNYSIHGVINQLTSLGGPNIVSISLGMVISCGFLVGKLFFIEGSRFQKPVSFRHRPDRISRKDRNMQDGDPKIAKLVYGLNTA